MSELALIVIPCVCVLVPFLVVAVIGLIISRADVGYTELMDEDSP